MANFVVKAGYITKYMHPVVGFVATSIAGDLKHFFLKHSILHSPLSRLLTEVCEREGSQHQLRFNLCLNKACRKSRFFLGENNEAKADYLMMLPHIAQELAR